MGNKGTIVSVEGSSFTRSGRAVVVQHDDRIMDNTSVQYDAEACEGFDPEEGMRVSCEINTHFVADDSEEYDDEYEIVEIDDGTIVGRQTASPYLRSTAGEDLEEQIVEEGSYKRFYLEDLPEYPVTKGDTVRTRVESTIVLLDDDADERNDHEE